MNKQTTVEADTRNIACPQVYRAIADVQGELAKVGIAKNRVNSQGSGYNFRGIDDVYAALSPLLAKHNLVVVPRVIHREVVERQSRNGGALFYITVHAEFDFVSALDGSSHTAATFGEAMDSGDKATNKAMSAAYKYAAFMTFAIPTEGDNDADATTHDVAAEKPREKPIPLAGPYKSKTALWTAVKAFDRTLRGISDLDELEPYLQTEEVLQLLAQCERDAPQLLETGEGLPPEYMPLNALIKRVREELKLADEANNTRSFIDAG